jgi:hypothetical protein
MVERANAPATQRAFLPHPLTHDATACPDQWCIHGASRNKLQIERARIQPHHTQPSITQVEAECRANRLVKHSMADQFAHVERNLAVVFDCACAFRIPKHMVQQPLACNQCCHHALGSLGVWFCRLLCATLCQSARSRCSVLRETKNSSFPPSHGDRHAREPIRSMGPLDLRLGISSGLSQGDKKFSSALATARVRECVA